MLPEILGDCHLGKVFRIGVPRERLGEREQSQWDQLEKSLATDNGMHVQMGDLFNSIEVPYAVVLRAGQMYKAAARRRPDTTFVIIYGNHDGSRDTDVVSAYEVFREIVSDVPNIICLKDKAVEIEGQLFVPWHPFLSPVAMLPTSDSFRAVYGHWSDRSFGVDSQNVVPLARLRELTSQIYTGHIHKPNEITEKGLTLTLTGSMQPYSHGEEVTPTKYRTFTLAELAAFEGSTHDLCIRLRLSKGESPPEVDCLQLQVQTIDPERLGADAFEVKVEDFDLHNLFNEVFDEHDVDEPTKDRVWSGFKAEGA